MIFIVLGTQKFQFNRLLETVDKLVEKNKISEQVFAQTGHSTYVPQNYQYVNFLSSEQFKEKTAQCSLLITHGGVATIISGLLNNKPVIVCPRLQKFGEHIDNHQLEIAKSFSDKNYVLLCNENSDLEELIAKAKKHKFDRYISHRQQVTAEIEHFLEGLNEN